MSSAEIRFRAREKAAVARELSQYGFGTTRWNRRRLRRQLLPASRDLADASVALARGDWHSANRALREHFLRRTPRFLIDPAGRDALAQVIRTRHQESLAAAVARADRIVDGKYDLLGYRDLSFRSSDAAIDWHLDPVHQRRAPLAFWARVPYLDLHYGDHKVIWEINRHQHWLALGRASWLTGDSRYAAAAVTELESWMAANPPLTGINWSSMLELALRAISWIWALHFFAPFEDGSDRPWIVDLLGGLNWQLDHMARHLSFYFSPNTHLLGEGLALYVAGRALPELRSAARWEHVGRTILIREATAQVHPDGGHAELSTHYHRYALDFYLLALAIARRTKDDAAERFAEVAGRLATFCRAMALDDGHLPAIGDDDGGLLFPICGRTPSNASDSLALAASLLDRAELAVGDPPEEVLWMLGGEPTRLPRRLAAPTSEIFPDSGYVVVRSADGHAILDGGRHGFLNAGHAHADALSLVLSLSGRPFLIDPGTATYTADPELRDRFRSTAMHNTVVLDRTPQSVPDGPFQWKSRADGRIDFWRATEIGYAEASHDGYLPVVHRRAVVNAPYGFWLVVDHILGSGRHRADTYWHLAPGWTLDGPAGGASLVHGDGSRAAIVSTAPSLQHFHGDAGGLGFCAPVYGQLLPSLTLNFTVCGEAPISVVTVIAATPAPGRLAVAFAPVATENDDGWHRAAVEVNGGEGSVLAVFATPPASFRRPPERSLQRVAMGVGELVSDARVAILALSPSGEPSALHQIEGRVAAWTGRGAFSIRGGDTAADLHCDGTTLARFRPGMDARVG